MKTTAMMLIIGSFIFATQGVAQRAQKNTHREAKKQDVKKKTSAKKEQEETQKTARQEAKEWKKRAREYVKKPQILKKVIEDKQSCETQLDSMLQEMTALSTQIEQKNTNIAELSGQITMMQKELQLAKAEIASRPKAEEKGRGKQSNGTNQNFNEGVVFRVQIGAFRNPDLSKYFENNPNFFGQAAESGEQKATIGVFRDYSEADHFKKYMRAMGVRDAWIVPFRDGERVNINDVLGKLSSDAPGNAPDPEVIEEDAKL